MDVRKPLIFGRAVGTPSPALTNLYALTIAIRQGSINQPFTRSK